LPLDPWGNEFGYEYGAAEEGESQSGSQPDFPRIFSLGPDSQAETADDIANRSADGAESEEEEDFGGEPI